MEHNGHSLEATLLALDNVAMSWNFPHVLQVFVVVEQAKLHLIPEVQFEPILAL